MQDNAPSHAAQHTMRYLTSIGLFGSRLMVSPDRNPIEKMWSIIKRDIYSSNQQYLSRNALWEAIDIACSRFQPDTIKKLASSIDGRDIETLKCNGRHIGKKFAKLRTPFLDLRVVSVWSVLLIVDKSY